MKLAPQNAQSWSSCTRTLRWKRKLVVFAALLAIGPVALSSQIAGPVSAVPLAQEVIDEVGESAELASGVTLYVLASASVEQLYEEPTAATHLAVHEVSIPPGSSFSELARDTEYLALRQLMNNTLPRLLLAQTGLFTITIDQNSFDLMADDSAFVSARSNFDAQNRSDGCARLLIFSVTTGGGGYYGASVDGPSFPTDPANSSTPTTGFFESAVESPSFPSESGCAAPRSIINLSSGPALLPDDAQLFAARIAWDPSSAAIDGVPGVNSLYHRGPAVLVVENGTLVVHESFASAAFLGPGNAIGFESFTTYSAYYPVWDVAAAPASALLFGVAPVGSDLAIDGGAYRSPTGRFMMDWDSSWSMTGSTSYPGEGYAELALSNTRTTVYLEDFPAYGGDPRQCGDSAANTLKDDPAVSNIQVASFGDVTEDDSRVVAQVTFTRTNPDGSTESIAKHIECRSISGGTVLLVNAFLPVESLDTEYAELQMLLERIHA